VASSRSVCVAPADYAELYLEYGDDIKRVVWRQLGAFARPADVDDGVQYILQQIMPRPAEGRQAEKPGVIEQYKPGTISEYNKRPVTFKAFLLAKVALYCRGLHETLGRRAGRELLVLDKSVSDGGDAMTLHAGRMVDFFSTTDEYPSLAGADAMDQLREALAAFAPAPGSEPVLPLFDALAEQFASGRTVSAAAVRKKLGKSQAEAEAWMEELRGALREVTAVSHPLPAPVPEPVLAPADDAWTAELREAASGEVTFELGGLKLSAAEVRAAVAALKEAKGNRVLPAFKDTGHRLAGAGKTWYLEFAETVMQQYPHLRAPVRRHAEGHFGRVKQALIYGLEQLVADSPVTEAVPVPVAEPVAAGADLWAELESVLGRFPGIDEGSVQAAVEVLGLLVAA
jgi:hypothetical protein